jgi:hypothetical protein
MLISDVSIRPGEHTYWWLFQPDIKINHSAKLFKWIGSEKIISCIFVGLLSESEKSWGPLGTNLVEVLTGVLKQTTFETLVASIILCIISLTGTIWRGRTISKFAASFFGYF